MNDARSGVLDLKVAHLKEPSKKNNEEVSLMKESLNRHSKAMQELKQNQEMNSEALRNMKQSVVKNKKAVENMEQSLTSVRMQLKQTRKLLSESLRAGMVSYTMYFYILKTIKYKFSTLYHYSCFVFLFRLPALRIFL